MSTSMIIPIAFFAVAIILILVALGWVVVNKRQRRRHVKADEIRDQAKEETLRINRREARAEETAAKARAAQAEADVKAAQASGLQHEADSHRSGVATSRDQSARRAVGPRGHDGSGLTDTRHAEVRRPQGTPEPITAPSEARTSPAFVP